MGSVPLESLVAQRMEIRKRRYERKPTSQALGPEKDWGDEEGSMLDPLGSKDTRFLGELESS